MTEALKKTSAGTTQPRLALRPREAAQLLGISPRLLWTMTAMNRIPHFRIGRRVAYSVDALRAWVAKQSEGGAL